jgi:hypothetical protein
VDPDPYGGDIENGKMYGRGTTDMKGAVAAMISAVGFSLRTISVTSPEKFTSPVSSMKSALKALPPVWSVNAISLTTSSLGKLPN